MLKPALMPPTLDKLPPPPAGYHGWPWTAAPPPLPPLMPDGSAWPAMSIVTPSYNQGQFIEATIRSVLLQGYPNLEYVVIDGGSNDESVAIIRKYAPWLAHWVSEPDGGQSDAIIKGMRRASGTICNWLNSDDLLLPGALKRVALFFAENPDYVFLTSDGTTVDASAGRVEFFRRCGPYSFADLLRYHRGIYLPQPGTFYYREAFFEAGALERSLYYTMDLDLWLRLRNRYRLGYVAGSLAVTRHHDDAKTWRGNEAAMREVCMVIQRYMYKLGIARRIQLLLELRRFLARVVCQSGLRAYFAEQYPEARRALIRAWILFPPVLAERVGLQLVLRLVLPLRLRRLIFTRP
jgi:glycosyltransferase involved in cell wall biosynthesis